MRIDGAALRVLPILLMGALALSGCNRNAGGASAVAPLEAKAAEASKATEPASPASTGVRESKGVGPNIGFTAPDFELLDIHGNKVKLSSKRGKVVLLNFWATWCGPCRIEMPTLQALTEDYKDKPFQVVAVAGDFEGVKRVKPFMDGLGLTFPGLIDQDGRIQDVYYVNALPMTYVLDKHGIVVYKMVGFFDWNLPKFRGLIEELMAEA